MLAVIHWKLTKYAYKFKYVLKNRKILNHMYWFKKKKKYAKMHLENKIWIWIIYRYSFTFDDNIGNFYESFGDRLTRIILEK